MKATSVTWRRTFPDSAPGTDGVAILIHVGDEDLRRLTLVERRALLRKHLIRAAPALLYSDACREREANAST